MNAYRQTGKMPMILQDAPSLPAGCERLWVDFIDLHSARGSNGFGPSRISFHDIDAWQRVNGYRFEGWERQSIRKADEIYLADYAARNKKADH